MAVQLHVLRLSLAMLPRSHADYCGSCRIEHSTQDEQWTGPLLLLLLLLLLSDHREHHSTTRHISSAKKA
jgi:hypothetical protein